jgi:hypothetical protein
MKKLSLKNAKSMLSRKEMKAINGGGYNTNCCAVIREWMNPWQSCGLTPQEAADSVCRYENLYPNSYWTCKN